MESLEEERAYSAILALEMDNKVQEQLDGYYNDGFADGKDEGYADGKSDGVQEAQYLIDEILGDIPKSIVLKDQIDGV